MILHGAIFLSFVCVCATAVPFFRGSRLLSMNFWLFYHVQVAFRFVFLLLCMCIIYVCVFAAIQQ